MNIRVLLVDDEPLALDRLRIAFRAVADASVVGDARNGQEALQKIEELHPDVVILDVQMPGGNGLDVARAAATMDEPPEIVFATAFDAYATEAFDIDASDYLLKPIRLDRLLCAIDRARRRLDARAAGSRIEELELIVQALRQRPAQAIEVSRYEAEIWAPRPGGVSRVAIDNLVWIEAARDYLLLHTLHRSFILRETMNNMGARLDPERMLRAHRSAFINKSHVQNIERHGRDGVAVTLSNGAVVRVGATYRESVLAALGAYIPNRKSETTRS